MKRFAFLPVYALSLIAVVVGIASCNRDKAATRSPQANAKHVEAASAGLHHWIEHEKVHSLMQQLQTDRQKTVSTVASGDAATLHPDAHRDYLAASEAAKRLAIAAKGIPDAVANVSMTEEDRAEFKKQADAMRDEARKFSLIARYRKSDKVEERLQALDATCTSCHTRFRDIAGEYQPPRA